MTYRTFDGKPVSQAWFDLLSAARRAGVSFHVSSGHRSIAEQWILYNAYRAGRGNLAAYPNSRAPHIRAGSYHAVDVDVGTQGLINFAARHGVTLTRSVASEYWHLESSGFAGRFPAGPRALKGGTRGTDVAALVTHLMWLGYLPYPVLGRPRSYFGGWVNTALRHFQADHNLKQDAIYGAAARAALLGTVAARRRAGWVPVRRGPLLLKPRAPASVPRHITSAGLELIESFEGYRAEAYLDPVGVFTIGFGHTGPGTRTMGPLSRAQAGQLLRRDVAGFEHGVDAAVKVPLTPGQFSALVSFAYNVGLGAFRTSTLLKKLNARDYTGAAGQFGVWTHGGGRVLPGLVRRRAAEAALFRG